MSEQDKQEVTPDEVKNSDSLTDESSTTDNADLISDLNSEESKPESIEEVPQEPTVSKAKEQRDMQVSSWSERYYNGEVKLEEVPQWIQREINKANSYEPKAEPKVDINAEVETVLAKREDSKLYNSRTSELNDIPMTAKQREEIKAEYRQNIKDKLPKGRALDLAMRVVGVKKAEVSSVKNPITSGSEEKPKSGKSYTERREDMTMEEKRKELQSELGY